MAGEQALAQVVRVRELDDLVTQRRELLADGVALGRLQRAGGSDGEIASTTQRGHDLLQSGVGEVDASGAVVAVAVGLFDGTPAGQRMMTWRVGDQIYDLDRAGLDVVERVDAADQGRLA